MSRWEEKQCLPTQRQKTTSQTPLRKPLRRKSYLPEWAFNADESAWFWRERGGRKWRGHKGPLLVRNRSEHQDLSQEGIWQLHCFVQIQASLWSGLPWSKKLLTLSLEGKILTPAASLLIVQKAGLENENPFSGLVPSLLCPWGQEVPCW